jgi:lipoyl(octanoyl) transferase
VNEVWVVRLGQVPYEDARLAQKRLEAARLVDQVPDVLLLLEHPPTYTKGRRSTEDELPMGEEWYRRQGIEVCATDRGGRVTYHGPGQLVGYPIISLKPYANDVHDYIRRMERLIVTALADWDVHAEVIEGLTGVWTPERRKIGSIGVHVSRAVTTHGFAVNVNNDLQPFEWIVPCGIEACRTTSVARELAAPVDLEEVGTTVRDRFGELYGRSPAEVGAHELVERVPGTEALAEAVPALR